LPLVLLSTVATVIASQSIITGAFSMTRQAIQLGWMPRFKIVQTSDEGYGQIYVGAVNWLLMLVTIGLALAFKRSDHLAGAYGIAVSTTMLMTTALLFIAMREIWKWGLPASLAAAGLFFVVDSAFFASNMTKLFEGGYVPLLLAVLTYAVMYIWHRGVNAIAERLNENPLSVDEFMASLERNRVARVSGTAVFLTRVKSGTPPIMRWYVQHSRALHEKVIAVHLETASVPWVVQKDRLSIAEAAPNFWTVVACYGFMERANLPTLMTQVAGRGCPIDPDQLTYFIGLEKIVPREDGQGLPRWMEAVFGAMLRNSTHVTDHLQVPSEQIIDLGRQVAI
jgi:KUP system potassium uptake protein